MKYTYRELMFKHIKLWEDVIDLISAYKKSDGKRLKNRYPSIEKLKFQVLDVAILNRCYGCEESRSTLNKHNCKTCFLDLKCAKEDSYYGALNTYFHAEIFDKDRIIELMESIRDCGFSSRITNIDAKSRMKKNEM